MLNKNFDNKFADDKVDFDKIVKDVDRQWNCLKNTPIQFDEKKAKEVKVCLHK